MIVIDAAESTECFVGTEENLRQVVGVAGWEYFNAVQVRPFAVNLRFT